MEGVLQLAAFILLGSLKASVLITLVLLAQKALGRCLSANTHYLLWLPVVLSLLTPFGFKTPIPASLLVSPPLMLPILTTLPGAHPALNIDAQTSLPRITDSITISPSRPASISHSPASHNTASSPLAWFSVFALLWLTGVLLLLALVLVRNLWFSRLVRRAVPATMALQNLLAACCRQTCCQAAVRLRMSTEIDAPFVTGCFRPVLLLPEGIEQQLSVDQLQHVFMHELMHVKRFDIAGNWLLTLLQTLHWFNPLVWFALTRMRQDRELVCDAAALLHLGPRAGPAYGHTLLQLSQPQTRLRFATHGLGIADSKSQLHRRISRLVQRSDSRSWQSVLACLLMLAFGGLAFSKPVAATAGLPPATRADAAATASAAGFVAAVPAQAGPASASESGKATPLISTVPVAPVPASRVEQPAPVLTRSKVAPAPVGTINVAKQTVLATDTAAVSVAMIDLNAPGAVEKSASLPQPIWSGWAAAEELTRSVTRAKTAALKFIKEWNTTAGACTDIPGQHRPRIACQLVAVAMHGEQFSNLRSQCATLAGQYNELARDYATAAAAPIANREGIAATMLRNFQDLTEFCSAGTYKRDYPAFAKLYNAATEESKLARNRTAFNEGFSDLTSAYSGSGNGYSFSPMERPAPNPADFVVAITGGAGANPPGESSNGGSQRP